MFDLNTLAEYTGLEPEDIGQRKFSLLAAEAEALIRAYSPGLPSDFDRWPESAQSVALRVVARVFEHQDSAGVTSESFTAGPFSTNRSYDARAASGNLWLSKQDRQILGGRSGGAAYAVDMMPADRGRGRWLRPDWWEPL